MVRMMTVDWPLRYKISGELGSWSSSDCARGVAPRSFEATRRCLLSSEGCLGNNPGDLWA
jgi:hypothetical protein